MPETNSIPPLSQSRQAAMACSALYRARHVQGLRVETEPMLRGIEIHRLMSEYVAHLIRTRQRTDYTFFDQLTAHATSEAKEVLARCREGYFFDPEKVYATELYIAADEKFSAADAVSIKAQMKSAAEDAGGVWEFSYEGTLDLVLITSPSEAEVHDYKSHFQVFDADTFQGMFYALLLMCLNPALERVRLVLDFLRYGAVREVLYTRADVPEMKQRAERERRRQLALHDDLPEVADVKPGPHCQNCPLLLGGCPLEKRNPYVALSPAQRLMQTVWLKQAYAENERILRSLVAEQGPIECRDDNGGLLRAEFRPKTTHSYPLGPTSHVLGEWFEAHPGDAGLADRLTVGGLSSPLQTKKRAELAAQVAAVAKVAVHTDFKVGSAKPAKEEKRNGEAKAG